MKHSLPSPRRASTRRKALVTGGLVALTAAGVGGAAFAAFTGTTNASQSIGSGTLSLSAINADVAGNRLTVGASDIAPGDTIQRAVTITTNGTVAITGMELTTTASQSSLLDTGADGLTMTIDSCPTAWDGDGAAAPYVYTCSVASTPVLATTDVIGEDMDLTGINTAAGATNHLRVTLELPTAADDTYQNQASTIDYTFDAIQRAGISQ
jgi:spore coat-associated protein N